MRVCITMFSKSLGLLQHAFLDIVETLLLHSHKVVTIVHPEAAILPELTKNNAHIERLRNRGWWDPFAIAHLRNHFLDKKPEVIITFGNRAARLCQFSGYKIAPIASICQNNKIKHLIDSDAIIASSNQLCYQITNTSYPQEHVYYLPNMINMPADHILPSNKYNHSRNHMDKKYIIGTIGEFKYSQGLVDFLEAMYLLNQKEVNFSCLISSTEVEIAKANEYFKRHVMNDKVEYIPLMYDIDKFLEKIDILCLPYYHQLCGIILLKAFKKGIPVVTTYHESAIDIARHQYNALMVPTHSPRIITDMLERLILDSELQEMISKAAFKTAQQHSYQQQGKWLNDILYQIKKQYHS